MVSVEVKEKVQVIEKPVENTSEELNLTAGRQVAGILEEAEKTSEAAGGKTAQWSYSVPFAGVRYYSF